MHAVTRRLHIAPAERVVGRGNRRATAGEREFGALTPGTAAPAQQQRDTLIRSHVCCPMSMDSQERHEFRQHANAITALAKELEKLLLERQREQNAEGMDKLRQLVADLYGHNKSYTDLVIAAGYAGSFAVWQFVERFISVKARFWAALLLLLSLTFFVSYEVQKMVRDSWKMRHLGQAMLQLPESRRLEALQAILLRNQLLDALMWTFIVIPAVATGLAGGALLLAVFVAKLFGYVLLP